MIEAQTYASRSKQLLSPGVLFVLFLSFALLAKVSLVVRLKKISYQFVLPLKHRANTIKAIIKLFIDNA